MLHAKSLQSCPTVCNPMNCGPPGSSVHGILQAIKWSGLSTPGNKAEWVTHSSALLQEIFLTQGLNPCLLCLLHWQAGYFTTSATWLESNMESQTLADVEQVKISSLSPNIFKTGKGIVENRTTEGKCFVFDKIINY